MRTPAASAAIMTSPRASSKPVPGCGSRSMRSSSGLSVFPVRKGRPGGVWLSSCWGGDSLLVLEIAHPSSGWPEYPCDRIRLNRPMDWRKLNCSALRVVAWLGLTGRCTGHERRGSKLTLEYACRPNLIQKMTRITRKSSRISRPRQSAPDSPDPVVPNPTT